MTNHAPTERRARLRAARRWGPAALAMIAIAAAPGTAQECHIALSRADVVATPPAGTPMIGSGMGIQVQSWYLQNGDLARIAASGFGTVRWGSPWETVETSPGRYDWQAADRFVAALARAGLRSVVILGFGNALYAGPGGMPAAPLGPQRVEARPPTSPRARAAFAKFAAAAAARYRGQPITWELWNEPDSATFWAPGPNPTDYATLVRESCTTMRRAAPDARIIGGAGAAMPNAVEGHDNIYVALMRAGAFGCLDGISSHAYRMSGYYRQRDPESVETDIAASQRYLFSTLRLPRDKDFLFSEWGFSGQIVGSNVQAAYLVRANLIDAAAGIPLTIWYEWRDSRADAADPESHFGLLTTTGGEKAQRSGLATMAGMARMRIVKRLNPTCDDARALLVEDGTRKSVIAWLRSTDARTRPLSINGAPVGTMTMMPSIFRTPAVK